MAAPLTDRIVRQARPDPQGQEEDGHPSGGRSRRSQPMPARSRLPHDHRRSPAHPRKGPSGSPQAPDVVPPGPDQNRK